MRMPGSLAGQTLIRPTVVETALSSSGEATNKLKGFKPHGRLRDLRTDLTIIAQRRDYDLLLYIPVTSPRAGPTIPT